MYSFLISVFVFCFFPTLVQSETGSVSVLGSKMTINWDVDDQDISIKVQAQAEWVGLGFGSIMVGSDAVIGWAKNTPSVDEYYLEKKQGCFNNQGVCKMTSFGYPIFFRNGTVSIENGVTTLSFIRPRASSDAHHKDITSKTIHLIYAMGSLPLGDHQSNRGSVKLTLSSGNSTSSGDSTSPMIMAHGIMMFMAWGIFIPIGVFLAAFGKGLGVWWFRLHVFCQVTAFLLTISAFGVIIGYVQNQGSNHFSEAHSVIGLIIVILVCLTPILGIIADKKWNPERKSTPIFPDLTHWFVSYTAIILAFIAFFLGLALASAANFLYILVGIWVAIVCVLYLVLTVKRVKSGDAHK